MTNQYLYIKQNYREGVSMKTKRINAFSFLPVCLLLMVLSLALTSCCGLACAGQGWNDPSDEVPEAEAAPDLLEKLSLPEFPFWDIPRFDDPIWWLLLRLPEQVFVGIHRSARLTYV